MEPTNCINCGEELRGEYCHKCGNPVTNNRLTFKTVFQEFYQRVFGFDTKFSRTLIHLFTKPGRVVNTYINGNRTYYMGPVAYIFWMLTVFVLLMSAFEIDMRDLTQSTQELMAQDQKLTAKQEQLNEDLMNWISNNFRLMTFALFPVIAIPQLLFFRKKGFNYIEHLVVLVYSNAQVFVFSILSLFLLYYFAYSIQTEVALINFIFFAYVCSMTYAGNKWWNFFKGLFSYLVGYLLLIFVTGITVAIFYMS
ncbi:DUF3667 domain-containing protein [Fulvivirga lutea]|uniref:DUF3667 domain-containing protein n=1 Tax=Fulvivirga lutea TaxID=2810512 RepID=A0A975A0T5_9BACT|nr:DUF3667 domain-containing protein [Fulvivirga lutea]QSE97136.1 DUF3667 domain-containing protein [Fulvivirga lutea]